MKTNRVPKTVNSRYLVKVNGIVSEALESLLLARRAVRALSLSEGVESVEIVRESVTETIIVTYQPKVTTVLVAGNLGDDLA